MHKPDRLPTVSTQTWHSVFREWKDEDDGATFVASTIRRLGEENPEISQFLIRAFERFKDREEFPLKAALVYACSVYRMLELEAQRPLPLVSADIGAPLQEEFLRDPEGFYSKLVLEIEKKNPVVLESVLILNVWYTLAGDMASAAQIPRFGLVLYKMLDSQMESIRLSESLDL